jgi:hypothetical protein
MRIPLLLYLGWIALDGCAPQCAYRFIRLFKPLFERDQSSPNPMHDT